MSMLQNVASYFDAFHVAANTSVTAGGGGDNSEVTGAAIEIKPVGGLQRYESAILVIPYTANIAVSESLSFRVRVQTADTSGGSYSDIVELYPMAVVKAGAFNANDVAIYHINPRTLNKRFCQILITPDLSRSGTDTASFRASLLAYKGSV